MSTQVKMEIFEGPLDLLLHLIKKNEVSIADIPIATITDQYLSTLELMQSLNLDVAGEFLVMAATLIHIKSRLLLPQGEEEQDEEEDDDPQEALTRQLMEYQRFKQAADELESRDVLMRDVFVRPSEEPKETRSVQFEKLSLFDLLTALRQVLERLPASEVHEVVLEKFSVREKMSDLLNLLHQKGKVTFQSLFEKATSRMEVVVTFLATLELVKLRAVTIWQGGNLGVILMELTAPMEEIKGQITGGEIDGGEHGG